MEASPAPDYRKGLTVLRDEWEPCRRCDLGVSREATNGSFVFGEGTPGGIMFIGEGPGKEEEKSGHPFIGPSGRVLRHAINRLGIDKFYITNVVSCRSFVHDADTEGHLRYRKNFRGDLEPVIFDAPPNAKQMAACLPRLHEEIYLVDPVLIVALGGSAADVLSRRTVRIQAENGTTITIKIPGAGRRAVLTEKKQVWARRIKGKVITPHIQNEVEYLMVPVLHPSFVMLKKSDERWMNPVQMFATGMKRAAMIYDRLMFEVYGDRMPTRQLDEHDIQEAINE